MARTWGGMAALGLLGGIVGCGARPVDDTPALATATAIPMGAAGATGAPISTSPIGMAHAPTPPSTGGDGDGDLPKDLPPDPFAPETPPPKHGPKHPAPKPPPKGVQL